MKLPMSVLATAIGQVLGLPLSPTHASMGGGGVWTPALWFLANEQGIWLNPDVPHEIYARRNLLTNTEFANTSPETWIVSGGSTSCTFAAAVAPDGSTTAIKLSDEDTSNAFRFILYSDAGPGLTTRTVQAGEVATVSVYAKKAEHSFLRIYINGAVGDTSSFFNLDTGALGSVTPGHSCAITSVGNGWYRCSITVTATATGSLNAYMGMSSVDSLVYTTGVVGHGIYLWGAQSERGPLTAYQKVTDWSTEYIAAAAAAGKKIALYQDSIGTTPVTAVEQPVGLVLDKRLGLVEGNELVANGTFDTSTTGWFAGNDASLTVVGQKLRVQHDGTNYPLAAYNLSTVAGKTYRVRFSVARGTSPNGIGLRAYDLFFGGSGVQLADLGYKTASGDYEGVFTALSSASHIYAIVNTETAGTYDDVDNISARELPGNHASQTTAASRPVLSARKNLLTKTEALTDALWAGNSWSAITAGASDPDGGTSAFTVDAAINGGINIGCSFAAIAATYVGSYYVKGAAGQQIYLSRNELSSGAGDSQVLITFTGAWQRVEYEAAVTTPGDHSFSLERYGRGGNASLPAVIFDVWHPQVEVASAATTYQRVNTDTDYDTVGFPHYLKFDGVDDGLATGNIDFTGTDKMTVVAGINATKASQGMLVELSASYDVNLSSFVTFAPNLASGTVFTASNDSASYSTYSTPAGTTGKPQVIAFSFNCGGTTVSGKFPSWRLNGVEGTTPNTTPATPGGNFVNLPLYIGRRAGTSVPYGGNLYSLTVRGAATTTPDLVLGETYTAEKTGVTL